MENPPLGLYANPQAATFQFRLRQHSQTWPDIKEHEIVVRRHLCQKLGIPIRFPSPTEVPTSEIKPRLAQPVFQQCHLRMARKKVHAETILIASERANVLGDRGNRP
jgi:hypothetical protein